MQLDEVRKRIEPEHAALRESGVTALYVFGSVARGDAVADSDVDFIVDYKSGFNLVDLAGVQMRLSDLLGTEVDVVTRDGIHRRIRDEVLREAVQVM